MRPDEMQRGRSRTAGPFPRSGRHTQMGIGVNSRRRSRPFSLMAQEVIDERLTAAVERHGRGQALSNAVRHRAGIIC